MDWYTFKQVYWERGIGVFYDRKHAMERDAKSCFCHLLRATPVEQGDGVAIQYTLITLTNRAVLDFGDNTETPLERMKRVYRDWVEVGDILTDLPELTVFTITEPLNLT